MPNRRRFMVPEIRDEIARHEKVITLQHGMQVVPGEGEFVQAHTDITGLDPIEKSARRGTKTAAERDLQAQRICSGLVLTWPPRRHRLHWSSWTKKRQRRNLRCVGRIIRGPNSCGAFSTSTFRYVNDVAVRYACSQQSRNPKRPRKF